MHILLQPIGRQFILILFTLFLFQCNSAKEDNSSIIKIKPKIDFKNVSDVAGISLSAFVDSISYVPLQLDSNRVIGKITKLLLLKDRFVIADLSLVKAIFVFGKDGKLINSISKGGGPGEPMSLEDVAVDMDRNEIYIYSALQSKILLYDNNGNFKKDIKIPNAYFSSIEKKGNDFLFYRELEVLESDDPVQNSRLCLIDSTGKYIMGWYKGIRSKSFQIPKSSVFFKRVNGFEDIIFESPGLDTLLQINSKDTNIKPYVIVDFGKKNIALKKNIFSVQSIDQYNNLISRMVLSSDIPLATDKFILGYYSVNGILYNYVHNIKNTVTISGNGYKNDLDSIPIADAGYNTVYANYIYATVNTGNLQKEREMYDEVKQKDPEMSVQKMKILSIMDKAPEAYIISILHIKH